MTQQPFENLRSVAAKSVLWRVWLAVARAYDAAWAESRLGGWWRAAAATQATWTAARRVRYASLIVAWAAAWQVVVLSVIPGYVLSGLPRAWFAVVSACALAIAIAAPALVRAWTTSALGTILARLTQKV